MAEQIDGEHFVQPLLRSVHDGLGTGDAGVVDEDGGWRAVEDGGAGLLQFRLIGQVAFVEC